MPYVFDNPILFFANTFTPEEQAVADQMISFWTNFHRTGNPNQGASPPSFIWPDYNSKGLGILLKTGYGIVQDWNTAFNNFWNPIIRQPL